MWGRVDEKFNDVGLSSHKKMTIKDELDLREESHSHEY